MRKAAFGDAAEVQNSGAAVSGIVPQLTCHRCCKTVIPVVYPVSPHLRADCPECGRYIKFVPQCEPWLSLAGRV